MTAPRVPQPELTAQELTLELTVGTMEDTTVDTIMLDQLQLLQDPQLLVLMAQALPTRPILVLIVTWTAVAL